MKNIATNEERLKNINSPFTELFSLLKRHENLSVSFRGLAYNSDDLKVMHQHVDNAIEVLLQGLQDLGQLIGLTGQNRIQISREMNNLGFFISTITNLTEALNTLRLDTGYVLKQRGITDY